MHVMMEKRRKPEAHISNSIVLLLKFLVGFSKIDALLCCWTFFEILVLPISQKGVQEQLSALLWLCTFLRLASIVSFLSFTSHSFAHIPFQDVCPEPGSFPVQARPRR